MLIFIYSSLHASIKNWESGAQVFHVIFLSSFVVMPQEDLFFFLSAVNQCNTGGILLCVSSNPFPKCY